MQFKDYYNILGINPDSKKSEIINSYKILAKKIHPDLNKDIDSTAAMQELNEAYNVLCNYELKAEYDKIYFNILKKKIADNIKFQTNKIICHYCNRNLSIKKFDYSKKMYFVTKIQKTPSHKIFFDIKTVNIPRCEKCYKFHTSNYKYFKKIPLIAYGILGFIWGIFILNIWFIGLIIGVALGYILGYILSAIDFLILPIYNKILQESDIDNFSEIRSKIREGWVKSRPI
jgi:hypothetical protein